MTYRPTSIDVAAMAGLSQATVSRVLNGSALVSARARHRVMEAARQLNYKVDIHASKLRSKKAHGLEVVVVKDIGNEYGLINPFFVPMIAEIVRYAGQKGYEVTVSFQDEVGAGMPYRCTGKPAAATIFLAPKDFEAYSRINHGDDHWVVWGRQFADFRTSCVVSDNEKGARDAVRHLVGQGRKRIAYLGKFTGEQWEFAERHLGYCQALHDAGLSLDERLQVDCVLSMDGGTAAVQHLLDASVAFDAIFAATDVLGIGAMRALTAHGLKIPDDVAIIGFDDLWICNTITPRLSTVRQNTIAAAHVLVDSAEALLEGDTPATTKIPTELVIRDSSDSQRNSKAA